MNFTATFIASLLLKTLRRQSVLAGKDAERRNFQLHNKHEHPFL